MLELHFQSISKARTLYLRNMLQTTKKDFLSINEYVLKMKELGDELVASGVNIGEKELLLYILDGLGPEYDVVVVNLTYHSSNATIQQAQFMLHKHEMRLERQHSALSNFHEHLNSALFASKQENTTNYSNPLTNSSGQRMLVPFHGQAVGHGYSHSPNVNITNSGPIPGLVYLAASSFDFGQSNYQGASYGRTGY
ncbi:uncharacterized protein LOC116114556 [Pistacia vera]|uniref:uncharacterized protein LOC116114556 n=1 Tax=Pistacia vera TaxID=55513 RepID=UPI00126389BA|nr:uncharacterized protein LOC116114556 [Pistacia vera]